MRYLDWHVGMKVVCLGNSEWDGVLFTLPVADQVYTISRIEKHHKTGEVGIQVSEIEVERDPEDGRAIMFQARCFRPVQPRKTDISTFVRILLNPHVRIKEDA